MAYFLSVQKTHAAFNLNRTNCAPQSFSTANVGKLCLQPGSLFTEASSETIFLQQKVYDTCIMHAINVTTLVFFLRYSPSKIICFSSCLTISELSKASALKEIDPSNTEIRNLSCLPSESIQSCLNQFVSSNKHILLLVANMDEVSHSKLSYARILIEESESSSLGQRKLFVVLIGYPTHLSCVCYPALFLNGWDHTFLHALQDVEDELNLRHWVVHCCTPTEDTFAQSFRETIKKSLSNVASAVSHSLSFAFQEDALHMSKQIKHLLLKTEVGSILCTKFASYFDKHLMLKYLRNSIQFVTSCGASRGIFESVQTAVLNDFADFLVIMMSKITENCTLETFLQKYDLFQQLFLGMIELLPIPEFTDISFLSGTLPSCIATSNQSFPFFQMAFREIESIIDKSCAQNRILPYNSNMVVNSLYQKILQTMNELLKKVQLCMHYCLSTFYVSLDCFV